MRKLLVSLSVCMLCLALPVMALAMTQTEWNQQCLMKTSAAVTLYRTSPSAGSSGEIATGTDIPMYASGTLPAGTYIKSYTYDSQLDMREIGYLSGGSEARAFVRTSAIVSAVWHVQTDDGESYPVPEALKGDMDALFRYLAKEVPGYTFSSIPGSSLIHKEKSNASGSGSGDWHDAVDAARRAADRLNIDENGLPLAIVYAPRTGKASLRQRAAGNGKVIEKLLDGTIVSVVEKGKSWTQVLYNGMTGYIINSALEFLDPEQKPIGEGMITHNGKVVRNSNINVRCDASSSARKITEWPTGTEVIVWSISEKEDWYEIEHDGMRVWIQAKFLTVTKYYAYDDEGDLAETAEETEEGAPEEDEINS